MLARGLCIMRGHADTERALPCVRGDCSLCGEALLAEALLAVYVLPKLQYFLSLLVC